MPSYIQTLREKIGPMKIPLAYASACVLDARGRLLWQRRADSHGWGLPGGVLELDESLPDCVVREVREETGLEVVPVRLIGVYSSPDFDVTYPNGDRVQQVTYCFACRVTGGALRADEAETLELTWADPADPLPTTPWYQAMVADLRAGLPGAAFAHGSAGDGVTREPYYLRVREHIGCAPLIFPAAGALVRDEAGRVLLQQRVDNGNWGLPGGALELGERLDQTAVHEVWEETGLEVVPVRLIGVYSGRQGAHIYPNGDEGWFVTALFECRPVGGTLEADGVESLQVRFFPPDDLPPLPERHLRRLHDAWAHHAEAVF